MRIETSNLKLNFGLSFHSVAFYFVFKKWKPRVSGPCFLKPNKKASYCTCCKKKKSVEKPIYLVIYF